jgi:hypothetical protein
LGDYWHKYINHIADTEQEVAEGQAKYQFARKGFIPSFEEAVDHVERTSKREGSTDKICIA